MLPFLTCAQGNRVETYRTLGRVLQEDGDNLESNLLRQLITVASRDVRGLQVSLFSWKLVRGPCLEPSFLASYRASKISPLP